MPTAARLVAALCLAVVAFAISVQVIPQLPDGMDIGYFLPLNICLGLVCGWIVMGPRHGEGFASAVNNGLAGVVVLVFWGVVLQGGNEMLRLAMDRRFQGPFEAILAVIKISALYTNYLMQPWIIGTILIGGIVSGLLTRMAGTLWR